MIFGNILDNHVLLTGLAGWLLAQLLKSRSVSFGHTIGIGPCSLELGECPVPTLHW